MALPSWARDTITRIRPGTIERRGSVEPDWSHPTELEIQGCSMQPATTTLSQDGRVLGITEGYTCFLPPGADVLAGDKIRYDNKDYQIMGEPKIWNSPTDSVSSTQIALERWSG